MKLLFFYGNYCRFCKLAEKAVKAYAQETGLALECWRVDDAYGGHTKAKQYEIPRIPAVVLTEDDGEEICRMLGNPYFDEECTAETLHAFFDEMLKGENENGRTEPESDTGDRTAERKKTGMDIPLQMMWTLLSTRTAQ